MGPVLPLAATPSYILANTYVMPKVPLCLRYNVELIWACACRYLQLLEQLQENLEEYDKLQTLACEPMEYTVCD